MEFLAGEFKIGEFANSGSRLVVTNFRVYKELISWRKRVEFFSIPLEQLDGLEKHILSKPALLLFGLVIGGAGGLLYTNRPDGALGLLALGAILVLSFFLSRKQGVAMYAGRCTIYFRGNNTQLEKIIQTIEKTRWERINHIGAHKEGLLPTIPSAKPDDKKIADANDNLKITTAN
ncbi:MAG: hypothetical protein Kow0090_01490 [Myxococcota bacterium]